MSESSASSASGRAAAIARRRALSAGKSALPVALERHRASERGAGRRQSAARSQAQASSVPPAEPRPSEAGTAQARSPATKPSATHTAETKSSETRPPLRLELVRTDTQRPEHLGRLLSMERRRRLSAGKTALPPPKERVRDGERSASLPALPGSSVPSGGAVVLRGASPEPQARVVPASATAHSAGDGTAAPGSAAAGKRLPASAMRSRKFREAALNYAPKVVESITQRRQIVTGVRLGRGSQVTGHDAGMTMPVSGTQYIGSEEGAAARNAGPKVGLSRTVGGLIVSGSLVRSKVRITGDESCSCKITGESEQCPDDDVTERRADEGLRLAQFQRQTQPHGTATFPGNLARTASQRSVGSRDRQRQAPIESTWRGLTITGSAVGRASRITGDEDGACHHVTGDQYLTPAHAQAECGGTGGGTAPAEQLGASRRDPITMGKVSETETWTRQRVTGCNVEYSESVTGDAPGTCALITGTPYLGRGTVHGWCDPDTAAAAAERLTPRPATVPVTGDTPLHHVDVTGTARGAQHAITGTPYAQPGSTESPRDLGVAAIDARFSVHSPQRSAHLKMDHAAVDLPSAAARITGSFALGGQKVTGNLEFLFRPRRDSSAEAKAASSRISGEGSTAGQRISGASHGAHAKVTGTEGDTAAERNPSERSGKPHAFAGATLFKAKPQSKQEDKKQLVTGMFGWSSKSAAKVTLSGGAQG